jgi:hypothetical protein
MNIAVGFRVKSGWATTVLVAGSAQAPVVCDVRTIDLCDPAVPESRQPYHAGMGMLETDERILNRRREIVMRATRESVTKLLEEYAGQRPSVAGLVIGSDVDPATITNPHMRAHAFEGRLFRTALEEALGQCELRCVAIVERIVYKQAGAVLRQSEENLKKLVTKLGRGRDGPWRADAKTAVLAALLASA